MQASPDFEPYIHLIPKPKPPPQMPTIHPLPMNLMMPVQQKQIIHNE